MSNKWPTVRLAEVLKPVSRPATPDVSRSYRLLGVRLDGNGAFHRETVTGAETSASQLFEVTDGDFIYSRLFAWRGAFGLIGRDLAGAYVSSEFPTFRADAERLDLRFLNYWFRLPDTLRRVEADCTGSTPLTRNRFKENFFLNLEIALPRIGEQRRIVALIEGIAGKVEEAKRLRGEAERERIAVMASYLSRLFGDPYRKERGSLINSRWSRLGDVVIDVADGPHLTPTYVESGVPFITVLNITSGRIDFSNHKYITPQQHKEFQRRAKAERGDVLVSKDGTIGIPCFVDIDREFSFFVSVALIKPDHSVLDGRFLEWVIRTPYLQERIRQRSRGDMIKHLVLREIRELVVPIPTLDVQRRIVRTLEIVQGRIRDLKERQEASGLEVGSLLPAVLDKAFRGEL